MMKVIKNFDLDNITLDLSKELNDAVDVIALDIQRGIEKKRQFGKKFAKNADSTIRKKGFDHPLYDTGLMFNADAMIKTKATPVKQQATLSPNEKRIDIAFWNDSGTDTIPARHFWGISQKAEKEILVRAVARIHQILESA